MPVQQSKSGLLAKLGNKLTEAHAAVKGKALEIGNPSLPEGIEGGVAQLIDCRFGEYKEGDFKGLPFFIAQGVVKLPVEHKGVPTLGMRTQIGPEALCDTPNKSRKTFAEHWAWVRNALGILGLDIDAITGNAIQIEAGIIAGMKALVESGVHFRFRTWKGSKATTGPYKDKEPQVQHEWNGACAFSDNGEAPAGMGVADTSEPTPEPGVPDEEAPPVLVEEPTTGEGAAELDLTDLDALADRAGDDADPAQGDAQRAILQVGSEAGLSEKQMDDLPSWKAIVAAVRKVQEAALVEEAPAEGTPWEPEVGQIYNYKPIDPKTKKPFMDPKTKKERKGVECEVTAVEKKTKTVSLRNLDTKTLYKGVKWDALENA